MKNISDLRVGVIFHHIGPYHHARLNAAASQFSVLGFEWSARASYAWGSAQNECLYRKKSLFESTDPKSLSVENLRSALLKAIKEYRPDVLVINGWNDFGSLISLAVASDEGLPTVVMSESSRHDSPRNLIKEFSKSRLLNLYSSALVGGESHREYLEALEFSKEKIFKGYDVIDNTHFSKGTTRVRKDPTSFRRKLNLPNQFFLASARFVEKKNLFRLIQAYSIYRSQTETSPWHLVLLGDGELKSHLQTQISNLKLSEYIHLPGFQPYEELPNYYGLANCFIHASTTEQWGLVVNEAMASRLPVLVSDRCGCAPDLVHHGHNGYLFDPYNVQQLADLMLKISSGSCNLDDFGKVSQSIISHCSPEAFANGLRQAVDSAVYSSQSRANLFDRFLLRFIWYCPLSG